jgi:hypothetical protein
MCQANLMSVSGTGQNGVEHVSAGMPGSVASARQELQHMVGQFRKAKTQIKTEEMLIIMQLQHVL